MKKCYKCKENKDFDFFYNNKNSKDGKASVCKICKAIYAKENQHRRRLYESEYRKRENVKEKAKIRIKKLRKQKDFKTEARKILQLNVARGTIEKPKNCSVCLKPFEEKKIHGHHGDYSKPLDVVWCCVTCHEKFHKRKSKYI